MLPFYLDNVQSVASHGPKPLAEAMQQWHAFDLQQ